MNKYPFKFNVIKWSTGRVRLCSEETQAKLINLISVYWINKCVMPHQDALIHLGQSSFEELFSKRIIKINGEKLNIIFLDKQYQDLHKKESKERIEAYAYLAKKEIREYVFNTHGYSCLKCGTKEKISIDHIVAVSNGGLNVLENLQPLCIRCNSSKGMKTKDYRKEVYNGKGITLF